MQHIAAQQPALTLASALSLSLRSHLDIICLEPKHSMEIAGSSQR